MAIYKFTSQITLPALVDMAIFWPVLLYRRLRYGYAFRRIPLTRGEYAIVDQADFEKLKQHKWHLTIDRWNKYAKRSARKGNKRCRCAMHRVVTNAPDGLFVDHINHNGLDNRKANLRIVTSQQNSWNKRQGKRRKSSKYKGLSWRKNSQKWGVSICIDYKSKHLGYFEDEKEAAAAYDRAAKKYQGEYAFLNFADG